MGDTDQQPEFLLVLRFFWHPFVLADVEVCTVWWAGVDLHVSKLQPLLLSLLFCHRRLCSHLYPLTSVVRTQIMNNAVIELAVPLAFYASTFTTSMAYAFLTARAQRAIIPRPTAWSPRQQQLHHKVKVSSNIYIHSMHRAARWWWRYYSRCFWYIATIIVG